MRLVSMNRLAIVITRKTRNDRSSVVIIYACLDSGTKIREDERARDNMRDL